MGTRKKNLTVMQANYVKNRAAGMKQKEAAIAAEFSPLTADRQASALETRADIKAAIAKAKRALKSEGATDNDNPQVMPKAKYTDSMEFLSDAMNLTSLPIPVRADYAKALLPYQHARIGEKGKKEKAKERAGAVAGGSKFQSKAPPGNNVTPISAGKRT